MKIARSSSSPNPQSEIRTPQSVSAAGGRDGFVEDVEGHVHVLAREGERGRPADGVVAAAEEDEAAVEALDLDAVAQLRRRLVRAAAHELTADHQPETPHVADAVVLARQTAQARLQVVAYGGRVGDEPAL